MTAAQEKSGDILVRCPMARSLRPRCTRGSFPLLESICPGREESTKARPALVFLIHASPDSQRGAPESQISCRQSRSFQPLDPAQTQLGRSGRFGKRGLLHPHAE